MFTCLKIYDNEVEIVKEFNCLSTVLSRIGNAEATEKLLAEKATKAMFNV